MWRSGAEDDDSVAGRRLPPAEVDTVGEGQWVLDRQLRNHFHDDPLLDWLHLYGHLHGLYPDGTGDTPDHQQLVKSLDFGSFIAAQNRRFLSHVVEEMSRRITQAGVPLRPQTAAAQGDGEREGKELPTPVACILPNDAETTTLDGTRSRRRPTAVAMYAQTKRAMALGVPLILRPVLHNAENKTVCLPQLLVRNDVLHLVVDDFISPQTAPDKRGFYYVVVMVRFSTLKLRKGSRGQMLRTRSQFLCRSLAVLANQALAVTQGYSPPWAYVVGRAWTCPAAGPGVRDNQALATLAVVKTDSQFVNRRLRRALRWAQHTVRSAAAREQWRVLPAPSVPELYPNMKNTNDGPYTGVKKRLAEELKEITLLWQCSVKRRQLAHDCGITRYDDPRLCIQRLGFRSNTVTARRLANILLVNQHCLLAHVFDLPAGTLILPEPEEDAEVDDDDASPRYQHADVADTAQHQRSPSSSPLPVAEEGSISSSDAAHDGRLALQSSVSRSLRQRRASPLVSRRRVSQRIAKGSKAAGLHRRRGSDSSTSNDKGVIHRPNKRRKSEAGTAMSHRPPGVLIVADSPVPLPPPLEAKRRPNVNDDDGILPQPHGLAPVLPVSLSGPAASRAAQLLLRNARPGSTFFVDFETRSSVDDSFSAFPSVTDGTRIALVGCGVWNDRDKRFEAKVSIAGGLASDDDEADMLDDWMQFMGDARRRLAPDIDPEEPFDCWHWSHAEPVFLERAYNSALKRLPETRTRAWKGRVVWHDLLQLFRSVPIVVQGALNFSLKSIARALFKLGFIKQIWPDSPVDTGLGAMMAIIQSAEHARVNNVSMNSAPLMEHVCRYLRIDVYCLWQILRFLQRRIPRPVRSNAGASFAPTMTANEEETSLAEASS